MRETELIQAFEEVFGHSPGCLTDAPGRVNLIGEHTDYNGGFVLPAAINFGTYVAAGRRNDNQVRVMALDYQGETDQFSLNEIISQSDLGWSNYVRGVVLMLNKAGWQIGGANLLVTGNVPQGSGLSSSASFEIALLKAFAELYQLPLNGVQAAQLSQKAENEFVGCACGIMDQLVSALGRAEHAMLLDCESLHTQYTPIPPQYSILIINSNVKRGLVDSQYNLRRQQCEHAASILNVSSLRHASLELLAQHRQAMPEVVFRRARHIITDSARALALFEALQQGDGPGISHLMRDSHLSMRDDFEITHAAIDELVEIIGAELGEAGGVRMTGGGFGGCVVALVPHHKLEQVQAAVAQNYKKNSGFKERQYVCKAVHGAFFRPE